MTEPLSAACPDYPFRRFEEGHYLPACAGALPPGPWLVLAPHADDETFGMGGSIALARAAGIAVCVLVLTDGALGGDTADLVARREAEARAAVNKLGDGVELVFMRAPDRGLLPEVTEVEAVVACLRASGARSVFIPSAFEPHPDHRAAALLGWAACRAVAFEVRALMYEISVQSCIDLLIDITPVQARKREAMRCYASQLDCQAYLEQIEALDRARTWSLPAGAGAAEGFLRLPKRTDALDGVLEQVLRERVLAGIALPGACAECAGADATASSSTHAPSAAPAVAGEEAPMAGGRAPLSPETFAVGESAELLLLREQLRAMHASTSWRVTAPLRGARRGLSALLRAWGRLRRPRAGRDAGDRASARRKVLVVMPTDVVGGAEVQTMIRLRGLAQWFDITVLTHAPVMRLFDSQAVRVLDFAGYGLSNPFEYGARNARAYARAIAHACEHCEADVVYGLMHGASYFVALARVLHPLRLAGVRCVGSLHGSLHTHYRHRGFPPGRAERWVTRAVPRLLDAMIAPSRGVATELVERFGARPARVHAIHNGFDFARMRRLGEAPVPLDKTRPWVITCCRLSAQKDFSTLLRAFAAVTAAGVDAELLILGEGEERARIEAEREALGLTERVRLLGFDDNPYRWMRAADVFVLSSLYEGFGNVLVEAMLQDTPVIATDCPWGPAEIISHEEDGLLVALQDVDALARALSRLLTQPEEAARLAANARQSLRRFADATMIARYAAVWDPAFEAPLPDATDATVDAPMTGSERS